jgi:excinuclease ABC subunit B
MERVLIFPAKHFLTSKNIIQTALKNIDEELQERLAYFKDNGKLLEAHRLESRTRYDMEMIQELGYCNGIENYSRHLTGRNEGDRPAVLLDYFPQDYITFIDESHVTLPQIHGMYNGDRARKMTLVDYGFRLPSALDNRPLFFEEFDSMVSQTVYVSATPGDYELKASKQVVEQIIRPTGLLDPQIEIRPSEGQVDDIISEINLRVEAGERVLVTTLTKKMAEDLSQYLDEMGIKVTYLHSEVETIERVEILRDLRLGKFDVLVGINLLREGIDLPEVSLVCILDAEKVGFLRSFRSLIQISGRAARHINGRVIMYADKISDAMQMALDETKRRRQIQLEYNNAHDITPTSIQKAIGDILERKYQEEDEKIEEYDFGAFQQRFNLKLKEDVLAMCEELEKKMYEYADNLDFEKAAQIRDLIKQYKRKGK